MKKDYRFTKVNIKEIQQKGKYTEDDLEYMSSLSAAVLAKSSFSTRLILWFVLISIFWLVGWAYFADVDELVRGSGKVIPSSRIQLVQNLEGGIVDEFYVHEGEEVKKGQPLLKIKDVMFQSSYNENSLKYSELKAKEMRLYAESYLKPFEVINSDREVDASFIESEKSLYDSNQRQLQSALESQNQKLRQKVSTLNNIKGKISQYERSIALITEEINIKTPLYEKEIVSKVEILQLQREKNELSGELKSLKESVVRTYSEINEIKENMEETKLEFQNRAKKEHNEVTAELSRIDESLKSYKDRVQRTVVKSPVAGVIKQMFINTVGGVLKPGMDIMEVVPKNDNLLIEAMIKPSDIAFLHVDQKAIVKFTAYDFSIYGGLEGVVTQIGADTITDEEGNSFYLVKVKTFKDFLGDKNTPLNIKVGMRASVDIVTGKKSILTYILKPIIKAKNNALRER